MLEATSSVTICSCHSHLIKCHIIFAEVEVGKIMATSSYQMSVWRALVKYSIEMYMHMVQYMFNVYCHRQVITSTTLQMYFFPSARHMIKDVDIMVTGFK